MFWCSRGVIWCSGFLRIWPRLWRSPSWRRAPRALTTWRRPSSPWPLRSTSASPAREGGCRGSRHKPGPRPPRSTAPLCGSEGTNRHLRPVPAAETGCSYWNLLNQVLQSENLKSKYWSCCDSKKDHLCFKLLLFNNLITGDLFYSIFVVVVVVVFYSLKNILWEHFI